MHSTLKTEIEKTYRDNPLTYTLPWESVLLHTSCRGVLWGKCVVFQQHHHVSYGTERLEAIPTQHRKLPRCTKLQAAHKLKQGNNRNDYTIGEWFHSSISIINENEKLNMLRIMGEAEKNRKLHGCQWWWIHLYNLNYYHYYAASNPGVFLDYTSLMTKDIYKLLREKPFVSIDISAIMSKQL